MFNTNFIRKIINLRIEDIDQTKLLYVLSLLVGLLSALAAVLLKNAVHYTHVFVIDKLVANSHSFFYFACPMLGMLLTVLVVKYLVKDNISHGISRVLFAISRKKSRIKAHNMWSSMLASTLTIGFGGSVGAEAPIVLTGSAIGSNIGKFLNLNYKHITLLVGCGAAGAVAGIFKAPIAGIVFTLEILMLDLTMSSIVPLMISSVTATTVAYFLMGEDVLFSFNMQGNFMMSNIPWYIALGIFTGLASIYFTKMTLFLEDRFATIKNQYVKLLIGGVILGGLIYLFPPLYGEGYDTIKALLNGEANGLLQNTVFSSFGTGLTPVILFMLGLLLFKVFASSATNGAGGVGGTFAPTLFLGGVCGYIVAGMLKVYFNVDIPDSRFVLAGMAGTMAGVMHAPLTAIFLIAEITGGYSFLIPLIITSTTAYMVTRSVVKHSIYHVQLAKKGELITHDKDKAVLTMMNWHKEIETDLVVVHPDDTLGDLVTAISKSKRNIFPVVDQYDILEGMVQLDDVREMMFNSELYETTYVKDLMTIPPSYIDQSENIETVMETFRKTGAWNLPVLDNGYYVGIVSKSRLYAAYREMLLQVSEE
ncbi:MAG: chloride channel protein [Bacteroidales bacterium]|nr:chloride channel protein [Bacteroidales bacterium]